jgi:nucleotide-binding universal stress UspA family protein
MITAAEGRGKMSGLKILLPYNFTVNDRKALEFVVRTFSHQKEAACTLFNVYTPVPAIETSGASVMGKIKGNLTYLKQKITEQEAELLSVVAEMTREAFEEDRVQHIFRPRKKDIAIEIIDLARKDNYDVIVLNRRPGRVARYFTGSVYTKVVSALKGVTVCIVS